jgi:hypothetical protein
VIVRILKEQRAMESNPKNEKRSVTHHPRKWAAGATAMLLSLSLLLSACTGAVAPPADATFTPETSDVITDTETTTETEVMTETDVTTDTGAVDEGEDITGTEEMTGTEETTGTEEITGTEEMTSTEEITDTDTTTG